MLQVSRPERACGNPNGACCAGVLSAANEKAVELFLNEEIQYLEIVQYVEACCTAHKAEHILMPTLDEIVHFDAWARRWTEERIRSGRKVAMVA